MRFLAAVTLAWLFSCSSASNPFFHSPVRMYVRLCLGVLQRALEELVGSSQGFTAGDMHGVVSAMGCRLGRACHGRDVEGTARRGLARRPTACDRGTATTAGAGLEGQGVGASWSDSHAAEALRAGFREVRGFASWQSALSLHGFS